MIRTLFLFVSIGLLFVCHAVAEDLQPDDPFAAVDGKPIYIGEINWVLAQRVDVKDLDRVATEVRVATAQVLVRRHLAMNALRGQGGEAIAASIRRRVESFQADAKRRGTDIGMIAAARNSNVESVVADIAWQTAWSQYLKSKMTDANLRRYFDLHRDRYAGNRYDVSQIFVPLDTTDDESAAATLTRMGELAAELQSSDVLADVFAQAAQDHSESASAPDGGRIGWVTGQGDLPPEVMTTVRETPTGKISSPVRSKLGAHLILVHAIEPGDQTFDDLTDQAAIRRDAADALFEALVASQSKTNVQWFVGDYQPK